VLEDGPGTTWADAMSSYLPENEDEHTVIFFDMMNTTADYIIQQKVLDVPGVAVVMNVTTLEEPLQSCRDKVRQYLHECDKVLRHSTKLGGYVDPHYEF
jgi:hypothetical protein